MDSNLVQEARELRVWLRTVGDMVRLQILRELASHHEMSVMELAHVLRISQPLVSWHLGVLRRSGLVGVRKEGRLVYYSLDQSVWRSFRQRLDAWMDVEMQHVKEDLDHD